MASLGERGLVREHASPGAPNMPEEAAGWFPLDKPSRPVVDEWDGFNATLVGLAPLGSRDRLVAFGRHGGPEILDSELARLAHLAALTASIEENR